MTLSILTRKEYILKYSNKYNRMTFIEDNLKIKNTYLNSENLNL